MIRSRSASWRATLAIVVACAAAPLSQAGETASAAGHWEGSIDIPDKSLGIRLDLEQANGSWTGTIDIPIQGLRRYALGALSVADGNVSFTMPKIPGEPTFHGRLADDRSSIAGEFSQSGQTFPFRVSRTAKVDDKSVETPSRGVPGQGVIGSWQGSLKIDPFELRLLLELVQKDEALSGTLDSIDQGANDIPISKVGFEAKTLHLEVDSLRGTYDGQLSADGSEIAGEWRQHGRSTPLVFKRLPPTP